MKKYLFITHLTPKKLRTPLREQLQKLWRHGLEQQTYPHWKALVIGEEESENDRFKTVLVDQFHQKKEQLAAVYERPDVRKLIEEADYIIKLDDDDLINPHLLETVSHLDFDLYCDQFHTFYDLTSGKFSQQERPWVAATCIHKKEWAFAPHNENMPAQPFENSIFYTNHYKVWHNFYEDKKVVYAPKTLPCYLRVLSPTTITAGGKGKRFSRVDEIDFQAYHRYLDGFGTWDTRNCSPFLSFQGRLLQIWLDFSAKGWFEYHPQAQTSFPSRMKRWLKKVLKSGQERLKSGSEGEFQHV